MMSNSNERLAELADLISLLSEQEQDALLKGLRKQLMLAKAEHLNQSIRSNSIRMSEILAEIQKVRTAHHAS